MLHIIEGLNGAGKSTVISRKIQEGQVPDVNHIPIDLASFSNPRKWAKGIYADPKYIDHTHITTIYNQINDNVDQRSAYVFGVYEAVLHAYLGEAQRSDRPITRLLDRSFVTAFIYGTITEEAFNALMDMYAIQLGDQFIITYLQTPIETCVERIAKISDQKTYALIDKDFQYTLHDRFMKLMTRLQRDYSAYGCHFWVTDEGTYDEGY